MDLKDALIPARVLEAKVEHDTHNVSDSFGTYRQIAGRRHFKLEIELDARNNAEIDWLVKSLQENGMRIKLIPDGSPIIHPAVAAKALESACKNDNPKEVGGLIW